MDLKTWRQVRYQVVNVSYRGLECEVCLIWTNSRKYWTQDWESKSVTSEKFCPIYWPLQSRDQHAVTLSRKILNIKSLSSLSLQCQHETKTSSHHIFMINKNLNKKFPWNETNLFCWHRIGYFIKSIKTSIGLNG